jgi:CDK inhibitor PHO81
VSLLDRQSSQNKEKGESFKAHRDVFFFTLQRELEKVRTRRTC